MYERDIERMNKYHATKTYSELCKRVFDSKLEARCAEELRFREMAEDITDLEYQIPFILSESPKIKVTIDFKYKDKGKVIYADAKGFLTRDSRTKYTWLKEKYGIEVELIK